MNKYLEAEKRLAELKGHANTAFLGLHQVQCALTPSNEIKKQLPRWCRDNAAAFALMVEHGCYPQENGTGSVAIWQEGQFKPYLAGTIISQHPDKETAVRYAIVMAVIAKLEGERK